MTVHVEPARLGPRPQPRWTKASWSAGIALLYLLAACAPDDLTMAGSSAEQVEVTASGDTPPLVADTILTSVNEPVQLTLPGAGDGTPSATTWSASGGRITSTGRFVSPVPGTFAAVRQRKRGRSGEDTAIVVVTAGSLKSLSISPASSVLRPGQQAAFVAIGGFSDGRTGTVAATWTATGGAITPTGVYTAGDRAGAFQVIAATKGLRATAAVTVTQPPSTTGALAVPADSFVNSVGAATHFSYPNRVYVTQYPMVKQRILELGIRHIRDGGWNAGYYSRVKDLGASGVKLLQVCDPRNITAQGCKDQIKANLWGIVSGSEGPNEYDVSGDPYWVATLRAYHQARYAAFSADPATASLPLVGTALVNWHKTTDVGDLGGWNSYANMHPLRFFPPDGPNQTGQTVETSVEHYDTPYREKPMWSSETGYPTCIPGDGISERAQQRYVPRFYLAWFLAGVRRTYIYEFIDQGRDPNNCESSMGIVRNDGTPKPAFTALKNLLGLLNDPGPAFAPGRLDYSLAGDLTRVRQALFQKRDGRFYLVLWQNVESYKVYARPKVDVTVPDRPLTLTLATPAASLKVYRPSAGTQALKTANGTTLALAVPDEPLVVEVTR